MWFAALSAPQQNPWFVRLALRLLQNEPTVLGLLQTNPFPEKAPRYLRAEIYRYHFATLEEHRNSGVWWSRDEPRSYLPVVSRGAE